MAKAIKSLTCAEGVAFINSHPWDQARTPTIEKAFNTISKIREFLDTEPFIVKVTTEDNVIKDISFTSSRIASVNSPLILITSSNRTPSVKEFAGTWFEFHFAPEGLPIQIYAQNFVQAVFALTSNCKEGAESMHWLDRGGVAKVLGRRINDCMTLSDNYRWVFNVRGADQLGSNEHSLTMAYNDVLTKVRHGETIDYVVHNKTYYEEEVADGQVSSWPVDTPNFKTFNFTEGFDFLAATEAHPDVGHKFEIYMKSVAELAEHMTLSSAFHFEIHLVDGKLSNVLLVNSSQQDEFLREVIIGSVADEKLKDGHKWYSFTNEIGNFPILVQAKTFLQSVEILKAYSFGGSQGLEWIDQGGEFQPKNTSAITHCLRYAQHRWNFAISGLGLLGSDQPTLIKALAEISPRRVVPGDVTFVYHKQPAEEANTVDIENLQNVQTIWETTLKHSAFHEMREIARGPLDLAPVGFDWMVGTLKVVAPYLDLRYFETQMQFDGKNLALATSSSINQIRIGCVTGNSKYRFYINHDLRSAPVEVDASSLFGALSTLNKHAATGHQTHDWFTEGGEVDLPVEAFEGWNEPVDPNVRWSFLIRAHGEDKPIYHRIGLMSDDLAEAWAVYLRTSINDTNEVVWISKRNDVAHLTDYVGKGSALFEMRDTVTADVVKDAPVRKSSGERICAGTDEAYFTMGEPGSMRGDMFNEYARIVSAPARELPSGRRRISDLEPVDLGKGSRFDRTAELYVHKPLHTFEVTRAVKFGAESFRLETKMHLAMNLELLLVELGEDGLNNVVSITSKPVLKTFKVSLKAMGKGGKEFEETVRSPSLPELANDAAETWPGCDILSIKEI